MFEQHPVPQQISSYQFRLVGDMTLKQFFQLAAGAVIGLIIYSLPLPGFLKWPLIALMVIGGAAFAFLPIQDRPLEQWLAAFFRSIYAPTLFMWDKTAKNTQYFATEPQAQAGGQEALSPQEDIPDSVPHDTATQALETNERNFLSRLSTMIGGQTKVSLAQNQTQSIPKMVTEEITPPAPAVPKEVVVPPQTEVKVEPEGFKAPVTSTPVETGSVGQVFSASDTAQATQAQFSLEAAPPTPPTQPNIVVGQVMDVNGRIVEAAILEIADNEGRPARALKTNKAGHFLIVTPLPNGEYKITTEKENLEFEPVNITADGTILSPIAIKAKDAIVDPPKPEPNRPTWTPQ